MLGLGESTRHVDGPAESRPAAAAALRAPNLRVNSELTTAVLRFVAGVAMVAMWLAGGFPKGHPSVLAVVLPLALGYATVTLVVVNRLGRRRRAYPTGLVVALTVLDNAIILVICGLTGEVSSPAVAILLLVLTTNAARFGVRLVVAVAVADSVALAVLSLVDPRPPMSLHHRLQLLGWWVWLLLGGATIAGAIARAALEAERRSDADHRAAEAEHRALAEERETRRRLEREAADRRDFLRVVTHELRTPITSLGALSRALSRRPERVSAEDRQEMLALIESHADHLEQLLKGVGDLATATLEARPDSLSISTVSLPDLIRSAADAGGVERDRLAVRLEARTELIRSDGEKLRRIVTNLLENAGRHSHGTVEVVGTATPEGLLLEVRDRGPGLSPEVAAHAFDKGFSFGATRGSSGLGLWIVAELAAALGGRVWAAPRPGGGLVVSVVVPEQQAA